jgi:hypothetical protein
MDGVSKHFAVCHRQRMFLILIGTLIPVLVIYITVTGSVFLTT